jgi:hypothetical protein
VVRTSNCDDGYSPAAGVTFDAEGNLYGTTAVSGTLGVGVAFKLEPQTNGTWIESVIFDFSYPTGALPSGNLIFDSNGNLYGTTLVGGNLTCGGDGGCGVVFRLTPHADGTWTESLPHIFLDGPSANPHAGVIFDAAGNLYGTTENDEVEGYGTVFKMTPSGTCWSYTVLHTFAATTAFRPVSRVVLDSAGNVYGTASLCGSACQGVVFEITP